MKEYEERAVSLALDRQKLQALTNKLKSFLAHFVKEVTYKWMLFFLEIASQESGEVIYQNVESPLLWAEAPTLQSN
ncbi:hypothetical protein AB3S75_022562 [Citrus x aurantiifolia]